MSVVQYIHHRYRFLRAYAAIGVSVLLFSTANAQFRPVDGLQPSILLGGTFTSNFSHTTIDAYSGDVLCGVFTNGQGSHFSLQTGYEYPLTNAWGLRAGIAYRNLSSLLVTGPFVAHAFDLAILDTTAVQRERRFDVSLGAVGISGGAAFHPFSRFVLGASLGLYFMPSARYTQTEALLTPGMVYRETLLSTRTVAAGSFTTHTFFAALDLSAGYDLPVSPAFAFRPYAEAFVGLTPVADIAGQAFRTYSVSGGVSLVYTFLPAEAVSPLAPVPVEPAPPTVVIKPAEPAAKEPMPLHITVRAVGLTDNDEEVSQPVVTIDNVLVTDVSPTLGYIFFDDGSATIPSRYDRFGSPAQTQHFSTKDFYKLNALGINHELLNVLGHRMQQDQNATVTLTGTRSLRSPGDSASAATVALARAEAVANYLQSIWGVAASRIRIRSRGLPQMNSDDGTPTGQAENRRVEISSNDRDVLKPVETQRMEQTATPPRIKFYQDIYATHGVRSNKIVIRQGGRILKTIDALSGESRQQWLWNIPKDRSFGSHDSVTWTDIVVDSAGNKTTTSGTIRIEPRRQTRTMHTTDTSAADKLLERFDLLLFDYSSSSELGQNSEEILNRLAKDVTPDATITVVGHTDVTGDPAYNDKLSYDRASRASALLTGKLKTLGKGVPQMELEARGSRDILFDNSLAEGRMLSRTVRVTIERSINR